MFQRRPRAIWIVLILALSLRLGWAFRQSGNKEAIDALPDQREYLAIASNIFYGAGSEFFDERFGQTVYAYRMPGYPWMIAKCDCLIPLVRLLQSLLDTSTVLATFLLARHLSGKDAAALLAALLVAINPLLIYFSGLLLSETLLTTMLAWGMVLLSYGNDAAAIPRRKWFWMAGTTTLALSIYVRPSVLLLPVIFAVASWGGGAARLRRAVLAAAVVAVILLPWAWRNSRPSVLGRWIWTTTNGGITAYDGWNPAATGGSNQAFVREMPQLRDMGEVERSDYLAGRARAFIFNHPRRVIALAFLKLARLWSPVPLSEQYSSSAYRAVALSYCVPFDLLLLAGLIRGRIPLTAKVFLMIPAAYLTVVHMASVGSLRYLQPAIPPMAAAAGSILANLRPGRMG